AAIVPPAPLMRRELLVPVTFTFWVDLIVPLFVSSGVTKLRSPPVVPMKPLLTMLSVARMLSAVLERMMPDDWLINEPIFNTAEDEPSAKATKLTRPALFNNPETEN